MQFRSSFATLLVLASLDSAHAEDYSVKWSYSEKSSPMDDHATYFARRMTGEYWVVLYCRSKKGERNVHVEFRFPEYLGGGSQKVRYRIDKNEPQKGYWTYVNPERGTVLAPDVNALFVRDIRSGQSLVVQAPYYDRDRTPLLKEIDISGIGQAIATLEGRCVPAA